MKVDFVDFHSRRWTAGTTAVVFLIPFVILCTGSAERARAPQNAARSSSDTSNPPTQIPQCGPLSLYVFLRLVGADVTSERAHAAVPDYNNATHLQALKVAASSFGIDAEIRKTAGFVPSSSELPAIVYMRAPRLQASDVGHFVVLVGIDSSAVELLDPVTAELNEYPVEEFLKHWTGYYLTRATSTFNRVDILAMVSLSMMCGFVFCSRFWRKPLGRNSIVAGAIAITGSATAAEPLSGVEAPCTEEVRSPLSDAANCTYIFASLNDSNVRYDEVKSIFGDRSKAVSMSELAERSRQLGLRAEIFRLSPTELARIQLPAIVLLDDSVAEGSRYAVLTDITPGRVTVIEGGMAVLTQYSLDDFLRIWSGYALVSRRALPTGYLAIGGVGALILIAAGAALLISPSRRGRVIVVNDAGCC